MKPTDEQRAALALFLSGENMVIDAGAGTGKTSTLRLLASSTRRRGRYLVFSRALADEIAGSMPQRCPTSTAHSLAYAQIGRRYKRRMEAPRMKGWEIADRLGITAYTVKTDAGYKRLERGWLGGHVMRAVLNFCNSADDDPSARHFPYVAGIDLPDGSGRRPTANNLMLAHDLEPALLRAWEDLQQVEGSMRFTHAHYLKMYQLSRPRIPADYILFDEAQDANPVLAALIEAQEHAQRVYVGDANQAIFRFTGAVDAMEGFDVEHRRQLSLSFRFGQAIADAANEVLDLLDATMRIRGVDVPSEVGPLPRGVEPDAILCRSNSSTIEVLMGYLARDIPAHLVGGGTEVQAFARAAIDLRDRGSTGYWELACFDSWGEVQEYCVAPETLVLTSDLRWVSAASLNEGDSLFAFDEESRPGNAGRQYRHATVERSRLIPRPCWKITTTDGRTVTSSVEHRWLVKSGNSLRWKATEWLRPGDRIAACSPPWTLDESREAGWLAGIFDGEGWADRHGLAVAQKEGPVLDRIRAGLADRGFAWGESVDPETGVVHVRVNGGMAERLRFLGSVRPERLVATAATAWVGARVETRGSWAVVRSVEDVGVRPVIAMATSSHTFIAEGLLSHNCRDDPQGSDLALMVRLIDEFTPEKILDALTRTRPEQDGTVTISTAHKSKGREWDRVRIDTDMAEQEENDDELRLRYVAFTRARRHLDDSVFDEYGSTRADDGHLLDGMHPQDIESGYNPPGTPPWRS